MAARGLEQSPPIEQTEPGELKEPMKSTPMPPPPESLSETGLPPEFVAGLVLKALYVRGTQLGFDLVDLLALPMTVLDGVLEQLLERRFIEVHETRGPRRGEYVFKLTREGRGRASEELEMCRYVGPAPVPFDDYRHSIERQAIDHLTISERELKAALDGVVVPDAMLSLLGPAINSGRSLFLYGGPGDGKTMLAERISELFGQRYYVPFAVYVDGTVMLVYDPVHHRVGPKQDGAVFDSPAERPDSILRVVSGHDARYAEARRPMVFTGGELTLEQLDLQWDPVGRMYQAPPQLKAAGGVLVVDDLGRQRVPVRDLLNRWVVPLEQRRDYLTLRSGRKIVVPFDGFIVFSTNLEPRSLADEAFLRRIHYKIEVAAPERSEYERIFTACCTERGIEVEQSAIDFLYREVYGPGDIVPRRCHPRDVLDHVCDLAAYHEEPPRLTAELLEHACRSYFVTRGASDADVQRSEAP
jgi:hypothetical protein